VRPEILDTYLPTHNNFLYTDDIVCESRINIRFMADRSSDGIGDVEGKSISPNIQCAVASQHFIGWHGHGSM
jgi:hypothetical protein